MSDLALMVFVKAPRPGQVKTRLAQSLGPTGACAAYRRMVETLLQQLAPLGQTQLCYSPDDAAAEIQSWLRPDWTCHPQGEGDLGARMARAFERAFANGAKSAVLVGSDCPEVTADDVREAWSELRCHDLVVGPATDGGYWLVGLRQPQPALFDGIPWSTDAVLGETLRRAKAAGLRIQLLRILTDVDTETEWREFQAR